MAALRSSRSVYTLITVASLLVGLVAVIRGTSAFVTPADSDLHNYFFKSADQILQGHPGSIYAARGDAPLQDIPNDDPPLIDFLIAPMLALARLISSDFRVQVAIVCLPFLLAVPVLGTLTVRALRNVTPGATTAQRQLVYALICFSPLLWIAFSPWGHLEIPLMLCALIGTLLALQSRRDLLAGFLAAVALFTSLTALFPLLALLALLVTTGHRRTALRVLVVSAVVFALAMSPFLLADRHDTVYSLVTWRPSRAIGGNSIWALVNVDRPASLASLLRRLDTPAMVLFAAATGWFAGRRLGVGLYGPDAWAVMAVGALALPMLVKANWPYYYAAPFVLLLVWESARLSRADRNRVVPVVSVAFLAVTSTLVQYIGMQSIGLGDRVMTGVTEFVAMVATALIVMHVVASAPSREQAVL
jgi:hypothetical protein